jgi:hypothetical protein
MTDNSTELAAYAALLYNYFASIVAGVATAHRAAISASTLATKLLVIALALYRTAQRVATRARQWKGTALLAAASKSKATVGPDGERELGPVHVLRRPPESALGESTVELAVVSHAAATPTGTSGLAALGSKDAAGDQPAVLSTSASQ